MPPELSQSELVLAQIESLPTLPAVAVRLLELTADDRSSAREIIQAVESDQSLSARLLALVRRAGLGLDVSTVDRAVMLLGFDAVRNLELSVHVFETFSHSQQRSDARFNRVEFWKHSLAVGCAAKLLAEELARNGTSGVAPRLQGAAGRLTRPYKEGAGGGECRKEPAPGPRASVRSAAPRPEEAFVCGLLHDIGKAVFDACFPKSYDRVVARVDDRAGCIAEAERQAFGLDHALAGSRLAMHWKLPAMIAESIWLHHNSPACTPDRLAFPEHVRLVQVADRLARHMRIGYSGNYTSDGPVSEAIAAIGLSKEALERVTCALPDLVEARAEFIGLGRPTSREVCQEALARANAELARANESLAATNRRLQQRSRCFEAITAMRTAIGDDPSHEQVARAAAGALAGILETDRLVVLAYSPARAVLTLAADEAVREGTQAPAAEPAPPLAIDALPVRDPANLGLIAESDRMWLPASLLPSPLLDRIGAAMDAQPAWCFPIRSQHGFAGAVLVAGRKPSDSHDSLLVLADWIGGWLGSVESAVAARRLTEEMAEMSQRLLASQAELAQARSLAMLGEMAAGAAHELNNPLAVISGRAQLLDRQGAGEDVRKAAVLISDHAYRASAIVNELMEFAKPAPPKSTIWDLAAFLDEVRRAWLETKSLGNAEFRLETPPDLPKIRADAGQVRVIFDELIRNAAEAMRETTEPRLIVNCRPDVADEKVVIRIQDNGCGMTPEVLERAFAPFYSHRPAGRGRGLGLSRAARLAEINGGTLRLFSRPGEGAQAILELPAACATGS